MDENSGDDMDDLLDEIESKTVKTNPKPLAGVSKLRPGLARQGSNSPEEDEDGHDPQVIPTVVPPEGSLKKPLGLSHVPLTARPKTNPNANLLGNPLFGKEEKGAGTSASAGGGGGTRSLTIKGPLRPDPTGDKGPSPFKGPLKLSNPHQPSSSAKTDSDWLGVGAGGGGESPIPSASPLPLRAKAPKGGGGGDPFEFNQGGSTVNPRGVLGNDPQKPKFLEPFEPKKPRPPEFESESDLPPFLETLTNRRNPPPSEPDPDGKPGGVRKKVVTVRKGAGTLEPTLQVPSHVIDQEELKRMFLSQKQLYENQLEMLENGYKEQMDCLVQSYSRKEEMLKEEMKMIQKDYEERMGRLKGELLEAEMKPLQSRVQTQEYFHLTSTLSEQLKSLQLQTEVLSNRQEFQRRSDGDPDASSPADLNQILDIKLSTFLTAVDASFSQRLAANAASVRSADEELMKRLEQICNNFETRSKLAANSEETQGKRLESELSRMLKEQKRLRETLVKSTVTTLTQSLETKHEDHRKKDKLSAQIREFRRDFQRLLVGFENRQDSVQNSQVSIQGEQKGINQNLHDLLTWLKVNHDHQNPPPHHHHQSSVQNEMELRLLKDERNAVSETIAKVNVDKRRLQDDKAQLEAEKRDLERRLVKVQDLETTLRIRIADAEETKKEAEGFRAEQMKLNTEVSRRMGELEKERARYREMTQAVEVTTGLQKHRQSEERAEMMRERDFLEKLRLQSLCPACLRLVRSLGDGIDTQSVGVHSLPVQAQLPLPTPREEFDIAREGKQLNQMIANYYGCLGQA